MTHADTPDSGRLFSGRWAVLAVVFVGLAMAFGNLIYQWQKARRALDFWGADDGAFIINAPQMEVLRLVPRSARPLVLPPDDGDAPDWGIDDPQRLVDLHGAAGFGGKAGPLDMVTSGGELFVVERAVDATSSRGVRHVRQAMLSDATFDWTEPPEVERWEYAFVFRSRDRQTIVLIGNQGLVMREPSGRRLVRVRRAENGLSPFLPFIEEQFETEPAVDNASKPSSTRP